MRSRPNLSSRQSRILIPQYAGTLCDCVNRGLDQRPATVATALARVNDPDIKVRLQLAMTLGQIDAQSDGPQVLLALEELAQRDGEDPWMQAAILSSVVDLADTLLARLLGPNRVANSNSGLLRSLASIVGARRQDEQIMLPCCRWWRAWARRISRPPG